MTIILVSAREMEGHMKKITKWFLQTAFMAVVVILTACVPANQLITQPASPHDVKGTYTLLLYGCHYPEEVKNLAILVAEESKYPVEIYDIDTSYKTKKDLSAEQALSEADSFLKCSVRRVWQTEVWRIPDGSGGTVGYEIRPLYFPLEFGSPDILLTSYSIKGDKVRAYIRLTPSAQKQIEASGGDKSDSSGK